MQRLKPLGFALIASVGPAVRAVAIALMLVSPAAAQVHFPRPPTSEAITLQADAASRWTEGAYEVTRLQGNVTVAQGATITRGDDAVVWVEHGESIGEPTKVIAYLEGAGDRPIAIELYDSVDQRRRMASEPVARQQSATWLGRYWSTAALDWRTPDPAPPTDRPKIYDRGFALLRSPVQPTALPPVHGADGSVRAAVAQQDAASPADGVQPAQFLQPPFGPPQLPQPTVPAPGPVVPNASGFRRIDIFPRSDVGGRGEYRPQPDGTTVGVITGGVNVIIQGIQTDSLPGGLGVGGPGADKIDLETDRAVIWTAGDIGVGGSFEQQNDTPLEIYMEGNIVFRQGDRAVYADRMYYDVRRQVGVILNAEMLTPLPKVGDYEYQGLVRLKAGVIRQLDESRYVATDALFTTSRLEEPSYHLGSNTITLEDNRIPVFDPATGVTTYEHERLARSRNNFVHIGGVPLLYWPTIATNLEEPVFYISDFRFREDRVFGTQVLVDFNLFQLLGMEEPDGVDWDVSLDYLSDRGLGYGTDINYNFDSFLGINGPVRGRFDAWAIDDGGLDNLGFGRRTLVPEEDYRGRVFWNHRHRFVDGLLEDWVGQVEVGFISDRTFLEQYYETEWDQNKDETTGARASGPLRLVAARSCPARAAECHRGENDGRRHGSDRAPHAGGGGWRSGHRGHFA